MDDTRKLSVIVAARPGLWRNALMAYLRALPNLEVLNPVDDLSAAALQLSEQASDFLLIDAGLCPVGIGAALSEIRRQRPKINCIALVDTAEQGIQAHRGGAERTIFKAYIDEQLNSALFQTAQ